MSIPLCQHCIDTIGGASAGPDGAWHPLRAESSQCGAAQCASRSEIDAHGIMVYYLDPVPGRPADDMVCVATSEEHSWDLSVREMLRSDDWDSGLLDLPLGEGTLRDMVDFIGGALIQTIRAELPYSVAVVTSSAADAPCLCGDCRSLGCDPDCPTCREEN